MITKENKKKIINLSSIEKNTTKNPETINIILPKKPIRKDNIMVFGLLDLLNLKLLAVKKIEAIKYKDMAINDQNNPHKSPKKNDTDAQITPRITCVKK
jgi:hypothetical protein